VPYADGPESEKTTNDWRAWTGLVYRRSAILRTSAEVAGPEIEKDGPYGRTRAG